MEWILKKVAFTNFRSTWQRYVDPGKTVVVCDVDSLAGDGVDDMGICYDILQLGRLFFTTRSPTGAELLVEFPKVVDVEEMIIKLRKLFMGRHQVLSWPEYNNSVKAEALHTVEKSNMYMPLSEAEEGGSPQPPITRGTEVSSSGHISDDVHDNNTVRQDGKDEKWEIVARTDTKKIQQTVQNHKNPCRFKIRCKKRGECGFQHTPEELRMFEKRPNQNFSLWKTKACQNTQPHASHTCGFAHSDAEAWCLRCWHEGHYTENCMYAD